SGIEALPSTRLVELWLEQSLFDGKLAIRAGQLAGDSEFIVSDAASLFVNGTFGGPAITSANLPAGWIAYPWATPAVRVKLAPTPGLEMLAAVFNGDPSGGGAGEPLRRNRHGTRFPVGNAPLFMGEVVYAFNQSEGASGLPGIVKAGFWYHASRFDDQRYGDDGLSLADPASSGVARRRRGNHGLYVIADQTLWRASNGAERSLQAFTRVAAAPGDRNLVAFYADGGFAFKGLLPERPDDTFGVAFAFANISRRARALDRDGRAFGANTPIRANETLIEITYKAQIVPGWTLQPDLQYIRRPGGRIAHPGSSAGRAIKDALMLGLRTSIQY
ncbi:MAG TPA: carbohydrate porin, partial [Vineibacter sp.]|nr:carbohydrate porin [Vineibacter sp.]